MLDKNRLTDYKHIIWDWNGTLLNDAWLCVEIINELLAARQKPVIDITQYQRVFDFPIQDYYIKLGFDFSHEPFEDIAVEFVDTYYARVSECDLQAHARSLLQTLTEHNISQSLLSASEHQSLLKVVADFRIGRYFTFVHGIEDHYAEGKVHLGKKLVSEIGLQPNEILFIGDTAHDFDVAMAIGADCLLIPSGHHTREKLQPIPTLVLDSLRNVLEQLNGKA